MPEPERAGKPAEAWPALLVDEWTDTRETLHMWTQIVGKIRLAQAPMINHWWQVPLYVSPRGLTTSAIPYGHGLFDLEFDFIDHRLHLRVSDGGTRVLNRFRSRFIGKTSPVHFFWGALDLACTRFSGRTAPTHPGGGPNCADWVMAEGYSHELSSCPVRPESASYSADLNEFPLPYEAVRTANDPDQALLQFLETTYEAAAEHGSWNRDDLEADPRPPATAR